MLLIDGQLLGLSNSLYQQNINKLRYKLYNRKKLEKLNVSGMVDN